jgi:tRNA(fMet)-specific endonuclease VapC
MKYLLDTNTCIRHLNQRSEAITQHFVSVSDSQIAICSIVKAELYFGAAKSRMSETTLLRQRAFAERFVSLPFDDMCAAQYARIRADLELAGTLIGSNDLLIASIALANGLILITHNLREFGRVTGLQLEDWESE